MLKQEERAEEMEAKRNSGLELQKEMSAEKTQAKTGLVPTR
jgi:hypothetical protein